MIIVVLLLSESSWVKERRMKFYRSPPRLLEHAKCSHSWPIFINKMCNGTEFAIKFQLLPSIEATIFFQLLDSRLGAKYFRNCRLQHFFGLRGIADVRGEDLKTYIDQAQKSSVYSIDKHNTLYFI